MNLKTAAIMLLILLSAETATADITQAGQFKSQYILGEKIEAAFTALSGADGIFTAKISCGDYKIAYYANIIEANTTKTLQMPALKTSEKMLGECRISAEINSFMNEQQSFYESEPFTATNKLEISMNTDKSDYMPGETAIITASGAEKYTGLEASTFFNNREQKFTDTKNMAVQTMPGEKSGSYTILAVISDSAGNSAEQTMQITIRQAAKTIRIEPDATEAKPGSQITARATLIDQAGDEIKDKKIATKLTSPKNTELGSLIINSGEKTAFSTQAGTPPGKYTITAEAEQLAGSAEVTILELKEIQTTFDGGTATITNTGNVDYEKETIIELEGAQNYTIKREISLSPGEKTTIDISKEIPGGSYTAKTEGAEAKISFAENRSIMKRTADGISAVTGAFLGAGIITSLVIPALMIVAVIFSVSIAAYRKKKEQPVQPNIYKKQ